MVKNNRNGRQRKPADLPIDPPEPAEKPKPPRNPPEEYRFKKGVSGNPGGKPKNPRVPSKSEIVGHWLSQKMPTSQGEMTRAEALIFKLGSDALKGNKVALNLVFDNWPSAANADADEALQKVAQELLKSLPKDHPFLKELGPKPKDLQSSSNNDEDTSPEKGEDDA